MKQLNNNTPNTWTYTPLSPEQREKLRESQKEEMNKAKERKKSLVLDHDILNRPFDK